MPRLVVFGVSSFCLAFVAVVGLDAYTATRLPYGLGVASLPVFPNPHVRLTPASLRLESRTGGCASHDKLVG